MRSIRLVAPGMTPDPQKNILNNFLSLICPPEIARCDKGKPAPVQRNQIPKRPAVALRNRPDERRRLVLSIPISQGYLQA